MGYKFQFVTLAGFHSLNHSMFKLSHAYKNGGMAAYAELQQAEFASEADGYTATRHQRQVGVRYFDAVATAISGGKSSTTAFAGSTEADQFHDHGTQSAITAATPFYYDHDEGLVHAHEWATSAPQTKWVGHRRTQRKSANKKRLAP